MPPTLPSARSAPRSRRIILRAFLTLLSVHVASAQGGRDPSGSGFPDMLRLTDRRPIFFPPIPPPLGKPVARASTIGTRFLPAPTELAPYVSEFFYPALGTRLATKTLNDKLRAQLDSYHTAKLALQNELRSELERLHRGDPGALPEGLAALSHQQAPKIFELEKTAEQLRRDLVTGDNNWSAVREWHLSDHPRRGYSPLEIAQVMRAYAFYQNNLLPAQRRILREISVELAFAAESTAAATAAQPYVFFPPEPARVLFPDDMPADVATLVASYQTKKSALKKELYDAVSAADGSSFGFIASPLKGIAEKQAARLAELDVLAEQIRRQLKNASAPRTERSPLPAALDARVSAMIAALINAQKDAAIKIDAILAAAKDLPLQASYHFDSEGLKFLVVPSRTPRGAKSPAGNVTTAVDAVRAEISSVADDYGRKLAEMVNEKDAIRQEAEQSLGAPKSADVDRAITLAMRIAAQKETENIFSDYRAVVFEPGLSPEQRRLLFDSIVERLELPLPRGELQPVSRSETW